MSGSGPGSILWLIVLVPLLVIAIVVFVIVYLSIRGKNRQREAELLDTPAGWYPDPTNLSIERYWDGSAWTEHERAAIPEDPTVIS
ncbi:DUF2510 domain-containing protein [Leucobacter sp. 1207-22]